MRFQKKILVVLGPTASGKSEVAFAIAKRLPAEIISCDSMQVYKGMSIVSQAPPKKRGRIPVHLVSFVSPLRPYDAAAFRRQAQRLIDQIHKKKKTPLLVGGTGFYYRALFDGLFEAGKGASRDEKFRRRMLREQAKEGGDSLHRKLRAVDPASAEKIHPNDHRRLIRALEVHHLTGRPLSEEKKSRKGIRGKYDSKVFLLDRGREDLYDRINRRVGEMLGEGLVGEVRRLSRKKLSKTAGAALGLAEMREHLKGRLSLEEAAELLKKNTRNYAKRQLSWFRHERDVEAIPVGPKDTAAGIAARILRAWRRR